MLKEFIKQRLPQILILISIGLLLIGGLTAKTISYAWNTANTGEKCAIWILAAWGFVSGMDFLIKQDKAKQVLSDVLTDETTKDKVEKAEDNTDGTNSL